MVRRLPCYARPGIATSPSISSGKPFQNQDRPISGWRALPWTSRANIARGMSADIRHVAGQPAWVVKQTGARTRPILWARWRKPTIAVQGSAVAGKNNRQIVWGRLQQHEHRSEPMTAHSGFAAGVLQQEKIAGSKAADWTTRFWSSFKFKRLPSRRNSHPHRRTMSIKTKTFPPAKAPVAPGPCAHPQAGFKVFPGLQFADLENRGQRKNLQQASSAMSNATAHHFPRRSIITDLYGFASLMMVSGHPFSFVLEKQEIFPNQHLV